MLRLRAPLIPPIDYSAEGSLSAPAAVVTANGSATVPSYTSSGSLIAQSALISGAGASTVPQYSAAGSLSSFAPSISSVALSSPPQFVGDGNLTSYAAQASAIGTSAPPVFSGSGIFVAQSAKLSGKFDYIWDKPMSDPSIFNFTVYANENFEIALAFPWILSQWPLPDGSYFDIDIRSNIDAAQPVLSFASDNSPRATARDITILFDRQRRVLILGLFAPQASIASLASDQKYLIDVRLTRPRGGADPRVDVIGKGFISILKGVTRG